MAKTDHICIGAIMGAFGAKGEVRVKSFCAQPEDIDQYGPLSSEDGSRQFALRVTRPVKGGFAGRIKGIRYKDEADELRGQKLFVSRDMLPGLPDDEYYYSDLIGLLVVDTGGEKLGKVRAVHDHGAGDFLDIRTPDGKDALLPFTKEAVPTIDLDAGRIVADPPEGVFSSE